ncbi:MAG: glycosyltransferase [Frankiales bacterium]|nr:glycosyltransferase [Frankiales bacterium]
MRPSSRLTVLSVAERSRLGLYTEAPQDPVGLWRTARSRLMAWAWRHRLTLVVLVPLLLVTGLMRAWGLSGGPALADDEGTYMAQAWAVQHLHGLAPYTYWYDHPPFGWLQLSLWTFLTHAFGGGGLAIASGRRLMVAYSVVDAGLMFVLGRRLGMRRASAALGVGVWALSPLAVGMSRMVYLDNLALPWLLAAFVLAANPRRDMWAYVASGLCFAAAVLTKETSVLVLPALLLLLWQRTVRQTRTFCLTGFGAGFVLLASAYPLLALLKGELLPGSGHVSLVEALRFQFLSRPSTGTMLAAGSGSRHVLNGWLSQDGMLLLGGVLCMLPTLWVRRYRPIGVGLALLLLAAIRPGYLPEPLVITVMSFCALAIAATVDTAWAACSATTPALGRARWWQRPELRRSTAGILLLAVVLAVVPGWIRRDQALATVDQSAPTRAAEHWLEAHRQAGRLLVDDTVWADLVSHGYRPSHVVWFYKLDFVNNLDPSVRRGIHSWVDFDIVLSTPVLRGALRDNTPNSLAVVRQALQHSRVLATFGSGSQRVEVRAVQPAGSSRTASAQPSPEAAAAAPLVGPHVPVHHR